jgi:uncharacterized protein
MALWSPTRREVLLGGAGLAVTGGAVEGLLIEPRGLDTTHHALPIVGLHPGLEGLVVAQLTDVHLHKVHAAARRTSELIDALRPDVVVLTGDIIQSPKDVANLVAWLPEVRGQLATFATLGNWELWGGLRPGPLAEVYARVGAQLLVNEVAMVERGGGGLAFIGLDDPREGQPDPTPVLRQLGADLPAIWMVHEPGYVDELGLDPALSGVRPPDLLLSGHTHGGQVRSPWGAIITPPGSGRFVQGWYRDTWGPLYVSRGVGTSLAPVRLLCRPEVAIFRLHRA